MPTVDNSKAKSARPSPAKATLGKRIGVARGRFAVPEGVDDADPAVAALFNAPGPPRQ